MCRLSQNPVREQLASHRGDQICNNMLVHVSFWKYIFVAHIRQSEGNYCCFFRGGIFVNNNKDDLQRAYRQLCRLCSIYRSTDIQIISTTASLCLDDNAQRWRYKGFLPPSCSTPRHLFSLLFTPGSFHFWPKISALRIDLPPSRFLFWRKPNRTLFGPISILRSSFGMKILVAAFSMFMHLAYIIITFQTFKVSSGVTSLISWLIMRSTGAVQCCKYHISSYCRAKSQLLHM